MPGNYTPLYGAKEEGVQQRLFQAEAMRVGEIAAVIRSNGTRAPEKSFFLLNWLLSGLFYPLSAPKIPGMDKGFLADDTCSGCGICARACPAGNIVMQSGRPVWQHRCQQCMACLQWCPKEAIQYGSKTRGRKRYHHPAIGLDDMLRQSAAGQ
jgi:ferredoxin